MFCFITERSLLHKILEVLLKTAESSTKDAWKVYAVVRAVADNQML